MSYGFRVVNDYGNVSIFDTTPNFIVLQQKDVKPVGLSMVFQNNHSNDFFDDYMEISFAVQFNTPMRSQAPPLVFIKSANTGMEFWMVQCRCVGVPGAWVGVIIAGWAYYNFGAQYSAQYVMNVLFPKFMIGVAGSNIISGDTHGIRLRDAAGMVVFDSGNNQMQSVRQNGYWQYIGRDQMPSGQYFETWFQAVGASAGAPPLGDNEYLLCNYVGTGQYLRYNGENAVAFLVVPANDKTQTFKRKIMTGRSGTNMYWPTLVAKETLPYGGTKLQF